MSAISSAIGTRPVFSIHDARETIVLEQLRKVTPERPLYQDLPADSLNELKEIGADVTTLNVKSLLFPDNPVEHSELLFPNLRTLAALFPNLKKLTITKAVFYGNPRFDDVAQSAILDCFPEQKQKGLIVHYSDICDRTQLSDAEREAALLAFSTPRKKNILPITEPVEKAVVAAALAQVAAKAAPAEELPKPEALKAKRPRPKKKKKVKAIVPQAAATNPVATTQAVATVEKVNQAAPKLLTPTKPPKPNKKKRAIKHEPKFPVAMKKPHILTLALPYLMSKHASLHFTQNYVATYKEASQLLYVSKAFAPFRKLFVKTMLGMSPGVLISPPKSYSLAVEPENAMEKAFMREILSRQHPNSIKTVDLRKLRFDPIHPYAWAEKICEKYPNIEQLHLPFGATLNAKLGQILGKLKSLRRLDSSLADKSDFSGVTFLTHLEQLYNQSPYEFVISKWATPAQEEEIAKKLQYTTPSDKEIGECPFQLGFDRKCLDSISKLLKLTVLHLGGDSKWIDDEALQPLSKLTNLQVLGIYSPNITNKAIENLKTLSSLRSLYIYHCYKLNNQAFTLIARQFPHLEEFFFGENDITDEALDSLAALRNLSALMIEGCKRLTSTAVQRLLSNRGLTKLVFLDSQRITDMDMNAFVTIEGLKSLIINSGTSISAECEANFRRLRPLCDLHIVRPVEKAAPVQETAPPAVAQAVVAAERAQQTMIAALLAAVHNQEQSRAQIRQETTGRATVGSPSEQPQEVKFSSQEVEALTDRVSQLSISTPQDTGQILDLRNQEDFQLPYRLEKNPNATFVQLPVCVLNHDLAKSLSGLRNLVALDIAFMSKDEGLSLLRNFPNVKELSCRFPYELYHAFFQTNEEFDREEKDLLENKLLEGWDRDFSLLFDENVKDISQMAQLEVLDLGLSDQITDVACQDIGRMVRLRELYFMDAPITLNGIRSLAPLKGLQTLSVLGCANLNRAAFKQLVDQFPNLTTFYCGKNSATGKSIPEITRLTKLETLVITDSSPTENGYLQLAEMTSLKYLYVLKTAALTDTAILAFAKLTGLRKLHITNCTVSETKQPDEEFVIPQLIIRELQRRLPQCQIIITEGGDEPPAEVITITLQEVTEAAGGGAAKKKKARKKG